MAIAGYFINYVVEVRPGTSDSLAAKFLAAAQGCFAVGRFTGSGIMRFVKPRIVLLIYLAGTLAFCAASIDTRGSTGLAMLMITLFFESVCFPTIVALGIRGLGKHTKVRAPPFGQVFELIDRYLTEGFWMDRGRCSGRCLQ